MKWKNWTVLPVMAIALLQLFSGCTAIGYGLGAKLDRATAKSVTISSFETVHLLDTGDEIQCVLSDNARITGEYAGKYLPRGDTLLRHLPATPREDYAQRARVCIGDKMLIKFEDRDLDTVIYLNADRERMHFLPLGGSDERLAMFSDIELLFRCDRSVIPQPYEDRFDQGMFESVHYLSIQTDEGVRHIDTSDIVSLSYSKRGTVGRTAFTLMGLTADLVILVQLSKSEKKEPAFVPAIGDGSAGCGCPFLFGWSGEEWRMETECFSGSVFRAAQRRDWARLECTAPRDGILRLRLKNLLQEIDSIDHLALLRVEHDASTEVVPTEDGRLLPVRAQRPLRARDDRDRDILPLLDGGDEQCWLAQPRAEGTEGSARRWMECEFTRPAETDSVTLILRVKNTDWGARMHSRFFSLFGSGLQSQYDLWNADPAARASLHGALLREGMLAVSLWDGSAWRNAGHVWEVGLGGYRAVALRVGISDVRSEVLRLRFEVPAAIWMVGSVGLSVDPQEGMQVQRISPSAAHRDEASVGSETRSDGSDPWSVGGETRSAGSETRSDGSDPWSVGSGSDCRRRLESEDGDYLVLDTGESADVEFHVPSGAVPAGRAVTWIVESSGYYRMKLESSQPPQAVTLERLFTEPGFFARYSDTEFRNAIEQHAERQRAEE